MFSFESFVKLNDRVGLLKISKVAYTDSFCNGLLINTENKLSNKMNDLGLSNMPNNQHTGKIDYRTLGKS